MDVEFYLVSYGRHNEICVVLSWASQSQVPRKLSKPAFPSLPKFQVEWCSLPTAALSSCLVVLAELEEVSELGWGKRLLHGFREEMKNQCLRFYTEQRLGAGCAGVSVICAPHCVCLCMC